MRRIQGVWALQAGSLIWCICLCGAALAKPVTIAISQSFFALPALIAANEGYFDNPAFPIKVEYCGSGVQCLQLLAAGNAQFATAGDMPIAMAAFRAKPPIVLATMATSNQNTKFLVTRSSGIERIAGLGGKRVALTLHSTAHYQLDVNLLFARGNPASLQLVPTDPDGIVELLSHGKVDAAIVWEPQASRALATVPGLRQLKGSRIYVESFNLVADRETARSDVAPIILKGLLRAIQLLQSQPKRAADIAARQLKLSPAQVESILEAYNFELSLSQGLITTMESQARWALTQGQLPKNSVVPNFLELVHGAPLRGLEPALVPLVQ